jgi:hypothetical protein
VGFRKMSNKRGCPVCFVRENKCPQVARTGLTAHTFIGIRGLHGRTQSRIEKRYNHSTSYIVQYTADSGGIILLNEYYQYYRRHCTSPFTVYTKSSVTTCYMYDRQVYCLLKQCTNNKKVYCTTTGVLHKKFDTTQQNK